MYRAGVGPSVGAAQIPAGAITNAHIAASAAIALSKLATTGALAATSLAVTGFVGIGTNLPDAGGLRMGNGQAAIWRDEGNNANVNGIVVNASDVLVLGQASELTAVDIFTTAATPIRATVGATKRIEANGTGLGFNAATPAAPADFTLSNGAIDVRSLTTSEGSESLANTCDVLGTLIKLLIARGDLS